MHNTDIPYLHRKNINQYFKRLSVYILKGQLGKHQILIVGGAAIALTHRFSRQTVDIDMCFRHQNRLVECCNQVARDFNLPSDWINADFMHSDSYSRSLFDTAQLYKVYNGVLEVFVAPDLDIYCMKLVSFRRPKDINDLEKIGKRLKRKKITRKDILDNFVRLYGSTYLLKDAQKRYLYTIFQ